MYAVITGDIVDSTSARGKWTQDQFSMIDENLSKAFNLMQDKGWMEKEDFISFRGDSFQCLLPVEQGLEAALFIKAALKGGISDDFGKPTPISWSCRLAIGIGEVTYRAKQINNSNGPAFQRSGHKLDELPKNHFMAIVSPWDSVNEEFELICRYLDIVIERLWTPVSARTAWVYLQEEMTQNEMAGLFGLTQSTIHSRIHGAELPVIKQTIKRYKSIIKSQNS